MHARDRLQVLGEGRDYTFDCSVFVLVYRIIDVQIAGVVCCRGSQQLRIQGLVVVNALR
jgi:hypothetical protein